MMARGRTIAPWLGAMRLSGTLGLLAMAAGCAGSEPVGEASDLPGGIDAGSPTFAPAHKLTAVTVSPATAQLRPGDTLAFTAQGTFNNRSDLSFPAKWTATGGTISDSGVYTAGRTAGTYRVIATPFTGIPADTAVVTIVATDTPETPTPGTTLTGVVLTPATAAVAGGASQQFSAAGRMSDGKMASVAVSYSATGGTVDTAGLYKAGSTAGTFRVIAKQRDGTLADTSTVTVSAPAASTPTAIVMTPASVTLASGGAQQFAVSARMSDGATAPVAVTYSATGGTVDASGRYTAGSTAGTFRVIAQQQSGTLADTSAVTVTVAAPPTSGCDTDKSKLTFYGNFEGTSPWSGWMTGEALRYADQPWSLTSITSPRRECSQAARFELRKSDVLIGGNHRVELTLNATGTGNGGVPVPSGVTPIGHKGSEVWWGWSVYVPSDFVFETGYAPETIMQVTVAGRSPAFEIQIDKGSFKSYTRTGYGSQGSSTINMAVTSTSGITRGAWTDFVVHAKWSSSSDGFLQVWKNGAMIVNRTGPNVYSDWGSAPYPKWGIYKWSWTGSNSIVSKRVLYIDAVRVTDGAHGSYATVAPR
jgi:hypothetical protein